METIKEIFDKMVDILTAADCRGALTDEENEEFNRLIGVYWTYYKDSFWEDAE